MSSRLLVPWLVLALTGAAVAETLHDPTRPPAALAAPRASGATAAPLRLSVIISASQRRLARINRQWVGEGDLVAGAEVVRIEPDYVRLRRQGTLFDLRLQEGRVQKRPSEPAG